MQNRLSFRKQTSHSMYPNTLQKYQFLFVAHYLLLRIFFWNAPDSQRNIVIQFWSSHKANKSLFDVFLVFFGLLRHLTGNRTSWKSSKKHKWVFLSEHEREHSWGRMFNKAVTHTKKKAVSCKYLQKALQQKRTIATIRYSVRLELWLRLMKWIQCTGNIYTTELQFLVRNRISCVISIWTRPIEPVCVIGWLRVQIMEAIAIQ